MFELSILIIHIYCNHNAYCSPSMYEYALLTIISITSLGILLGHLAMFVQNFRYVARRCVPEHCSCDPLSAKVARPCVTSFL